MPDDAKEASDMECGQSLEIGAETKAASFAT